MGRDEQKQGLLTLHLPQWVAWGVIPQESKAKLEGKEIAEANSPEAVKHVAAAALAAVLTSSLRSPW